MITTANEMGGIRPGINLRKKTKLLATMQRTREKIGKMIHKKCIGTRGSTYCFVSASGSPSHRFNAVKKLHIKIKKMKQNAEPNPMNN